MDELWFVFRAEQYYPEGGDGDLYGVCDSQRDAEVLCAELGVDSWLVTLSEMKKDANDRLERTREYARRRDQARKGKG